MWVVVLLLGALAACSSDEPMTATPSELIVVEMPEWVAHFERADATGTFALHRLGTDEVLVHDADRAVDAVLPASTFKILNSLIALETGVLATVDELVPWDGVVRPIDAWNVDHSLRTGIEVSAVWAYQEIARQVGETRMAEQVNAAGFGNADIAGGIDRFWLDGALRISPIEQLDFLAALMNDDLPFAPEHQAAVRDILVRESGDGWTWGHKTGTALATQPVLGWLVGFVEHDGDTWVFAMNLDLGDVEVDSQIDPQLRQALTRTIPEDAGALPAG